MLILVPAMVMAQTDGKTASKAAAKPAAKQATAKKAPAKPAKKVSTKAKSNPASSRTQLRSATSQVASGMAAAEAALTPAELAIAEGVYQGHIQCELGATVNISKDSVNPGYFFVEGKGFRYHMSPVATSTGAVRLEDAKQGAMWLQVANKSMLINRKQGQRMADECKSPEQSQFAEAMKNQPATDLLGGSK
ncbi:hypothetical protein GCM10027082_35380 [Comamonas humi]